MSPPKCMTTELLRIRRFANDKVWTSHSIDARMDAITRIQSPVSGLVLGVSHTIWYEVSAMQYGADV